MINIIVYKNALKLTTLGIILNTEYYYHRKTKEKQSSENTPRGIKDFNKIYIPAPADSELKDWLFAKLKESKGVLSLTTVKDRSGYTVIYKGGQGGFDFFSCDAPTDADATFLLIIKLLKHGKIKI